MKIKFFILVLTLVCQACYGQLNFKDYSIQHYTIKNGLPSNCIYTAIEDKDGYIWFSTENGISRFDGKNFVNYNVKDGLLDNAVFGVILTDKFLFNYTLRGTNSIVNNKVTNDYNYLFKTNAYSRLAEFQIDSFFVSARYDSVFLFDMQSLKLKYSFSINDSIPNLKWTNIFKSYPDKNRIIFYTKYSQIFLALSPNSKSLTLVSKDLKTKIDVDLSFMKQSIAWLSNHKDKIYLCNKANEFYEGTILENSVDFRKIEIGKENYQPNSIYIDSKENIYLNTLNKGILIFSKKGKVKPIHTSELKLNFDSEWIKKNGTKLELGSIKSVFKYSKDTFLVGIHNGSIVYDNENNKIVKWLSEMRTYSMFADKQRNIYIGSYEGLYKYDYRTNLISPVHFTKNDKIKINSLAEDKDRNLWIVTAGNGVFKYNLVSKLTTHILESDGLLNNSNDKIFIDAKDRKWLSSNRGVQVIDRNRMFRIDESEGLTSSDIIDIVVRGDTLWTKTLLGVEQYIYKSDTSPQIIPFHLNFVKINNEKFDTLPRILKASQAKLEFSFIGIYLAAPDQIKYRYQLYLNGKKLSDWREISETNILLENMDYGDYELKIQAFHSNYPNIHSEIKSYKYKVKAYIYKTWWFWIVPTLLFFGGLIYLILGYQLRKKRGELERSVLEAKLSKYQLSALQQQMNPHFIFNSMSTIQNLVIHDNKKSALSFISDFSQLMRSILQSSRLDSVSLSKDLDFIKKYVALEQVRYEHSFDIEFKSNIDAEDMDEIKIPTMLIQPLVENAIKHGVSNLEDRKGKITIICNLDDEEKYLTIQIIDNGLGENLTKAKNHESSALKIISERLELFRIENRKGSFTIKYNPDVTISNLRLPI